MAITISLQGKEWTKDSVKNLIITNDKATVRALLRIYEGQTEDEKETKETRHDNGMGFNGLDAEILTSIAEWYNEKGFVTPKQMNILKKRMPKYAGQIFKYMQRKAEEEKESMKPVLLSVKYYEIGKEPVCQNIQIDSDDNDFVNDRGLMISHERLSTGEFAWWIGDANDEICMIKDLPILDATDLHTLIDYYIENQ